MILLTKLVSGEEIISDTQIVTAQKSDDIYICLLKKPYQIITVPTETGVGIQMIPWMSYAKDHTVPMPLDMIMTQVEVDTDLYNSYNGQFGSGIQIKEKSGIVLH